MDNEILENIDEIKKYDINLGIAYWNLYQYINNIENKDSFIEIGKKNRKLRLLIDTYITRIRLNPTGQDYFKFINISNKLRDCIKDIAEEDDKVWKCFTILQAIIITIYITGEQINDETKHIPNRDIHNDEFINRIIDNDSELARLKVYFGELGIIDIEKEDCIPYNKEIWLTVAKKLNLFPTQNESMAFQNEDERLPYGIRIDSNKKEGLESKNMNSYYLNIIKKIGEVYKNEFGVEYPIKYAERINHDISENAGGFFNPKDKSIYIFSDIVDKIRYKNYHNSMDNPKDNGLSFLIYSCFHELEHRLQDEHPELLKNQLPYARSIYQIEDAIIACSLTEKDSFYEDMHDMFLKEIDADTKGVDNARVFARWKSIENLNSDYYELMERYNKYRVANYDIPAIINRFNNYAKKYDGIVCTPTFIKDETIRRMYNSNGTVKTIGELMELSKSGVLSKDILPYVVCSLDCIKKSLDINNSLPRQQAKYLLQCIQVVLKEHETKMKELREKFPKINITIRVLSEYTKVTDASSTKKMIKMYNESYYEYLTKLEKTLDGIFQDGSDAR